MNVTEASGKWRLTDHHIENRETGEIKKIKNPPSASAVAHMDLAKFQRKCNSAFITGEWPMTHWKSGRVTY